MTCSGSFYSNNIKCRPVPRDTRMGLNSIARTPPHRHQRIHVLWSLRQWQEREATLMSHWLAIKSGHPYGKKELICTGVAPATDDHISNQTAQQQENEEKKSRASFFIPQSSSQRSTEKLKKVTHCKLNKLRFFPDTCSAIILKSRSIRRGQFHAFP